MCADLFLWVAVVVKSLDVETHKHQRYRMRGAACPKQHRAECVLRLPSALGLRLFLSVQDAALPVRMARRQFETTILIGKGYASILQPILWLPAVSHRLCPRFSPEEQPSKRHRKGVMSAAGDGSANGATAEASKKVNVSNGFPV